MVPYKPDICDLYSHGSLEYVITCDFKVKCLVIVVIMTFHLFPSGRLIPLDKELFILQQLNKIMEKCAETVDVLRMGETVMKQVGYVQIIHC